MSVVKHFIEDSIKKTEIDEFLQNEFERAGYGGVSITKTPLGTHLVIYTMRPGLVIGRGGETIRALAQVLEEKFQLPSPQISVAEIEIPELNAYVVASRIASALKRGVHYRRAGFWGLTQTMEAGALGAEIIISGKLRTDRARYEKFRTGYLPKSGEPPRRYMRKAELHVQLKPGILGVKVRLIPPDAQFPDQVKVHVIEEEESEPITETTSMEEPIAAKEKAPEPEEKAPVKEKPAPPAVEEKAVTKEKVAEPEAPKVEQKPVAEKPAAKKKVKTEAAKVAEEKKATKKKVSKPETPAKAKKPAEKKAEPKATEAVVVEKEKKTAKKKVSKPKSPAKAKKASPKKKAKTKEVAEEKEKAPKKKTIKPKVSAVKEEKPPKKKPAKKKVTKPKASKVKEKAAPKKKAAKAKTTPAKEKKATKKKVAKPKATSAKEKKEAEK
ncbi:MAG: 30S ribosomal protein S3 [Candidatus Bathyarchaeota archaeon]|jgi:small subunit ribosomal protein S3